MALFELYRREAGSGRVTLPGVVEHLEVEDVGPRVVAGCVENDRYPCTVSIGGAEAAVGNARYEHVRKARRKQPLIYPTIGVERPL